MIEGRHTNMTAQKDCRSSWGMATVLRAIQTNIASQLKEKVGNLEHFSNG
jgi:hypothetical protein